MDIEDWYHLDYFQGGSVDRSYSMLDGLDTYLEILNDLRVPSSFFCVGEIAPTVAARLRLIASRGFDVGSHTHSHRRPLTLSMSEFREEMRRSKQTIEDITRRPADGFRAPCFSMDEARLNAVQEAGFLYDSSRIQFSSHPLYGTLSLDGFSVVSDYIYRRGDFFEFEAPTVSIGRKTLPISGGGYLRIFPWLVMRRLISGFCNRHTFYTLYIHPFELSSRQAVPLPRQTSRASRLRFNLGRSTTQAKLLRLIALLKSYGFEFTTFAGLYARLMGNNISPLEK